MAYFYDVGRPSSVERSRYRDQPVVASFRKRRILSRFRWPHRTWQPPRPVAVTGPPYRS